MERLLDADDPMDIAQAQAVSKVGDTIVNAAKVELDFIRLTGVTPPAGLFSSGDDDVKPLAKLEGSGDLSELCLQCPLPDCDETSAKCLIQIETRKK